MWILKLLKNEKGSTTAEYLILALLIIGVAAAVVTGLKTPLANTHNNAVDKIIDITGSGY